MYSTSRHLKTELTASDFQIKWSNAHFTKSLNCTVQSNSNGAILKDLDKHYKRVSENFCA
jgi:hypothetical protein